MNIEWKAIPDTKGYYEVSNEGQVRNTRTDKVLKPRRCQSGKYLKVILSVDSHRTQHYIHHLVAAAFIGERPEGQLVLHWDDNGHNNHVSNLRYGTQKQNRADAKRNGRQLGPKPKLTDEDRTEIKRLRTAGELLTVIAAQFGIDPTMVSKLALGHR